MDPQLLGVSIVPWPGRHVLVRESKRWRPWRVARMGFPDRGKLSLRSTDQVIRASEEALRSFSEPAGCAILP